MVPCYRYKDWSPAKRKEAFLVAQSVKDGNKRSKAISADTGIPSPTVHRLLHALEVTRFVDGQGYGGRRPKDWSWVDGADIDRLRN